MVLDPSGCLKSRQDDLLIVFFSVVLPSPFVKSANSEAIREPSEPISQDSSLIGAQTLAYPYGACGPHGTCVRTASTGAIWAALTTGDMNSESGGTEKRENDGFYCICQAGFQVGSMGLDEFTCFFLLFILRETCVENNLRLLSSKHNS
ncbi:unnamed protein product [Protopolystoma xenopodis]|uniref:Uncharacterized protein n=1 Tax=Protopolystoma xenopodis TaxID=117903 RepID=A0A3S5A265_9PLAT|nr:unnamed protein product [Protopolystoma xenopodis]